MKKRLCLYCFYSSFWNYLHIASGHTSFSSAAIRTASTVLRAPSLLNMLLSTEFTVFTESDYDKCGSNRARIYTVEDSFASLSNGSVNYTQIKYIRVDGDAYIPPGISMCTNKSDNFSRAVVVDVKGKLTIASEVSSGTPNGLTCNRDTYDDIAEVPQNLIFARDILIDSEVVNIDAWLIASTSIRNDFSSNNGTGTIDTCVQYQSGSPTNPTTYAVEDDSFGADRCTKALTINGPVFAHSIKLNRTAGLGFIDRTLAAQGHGRDSVKSGEIFNLRADAYLWAYAQTQRFTQAVVTYSRELAPRY